MTAGALTRVSCVLFDLDGTLVDSAPGITECLAQTVREFGGDDHPPESLREFVGPPVVETLRALTRVPAPELPRVVQHYRALYWERGMHESSVFPGIRALLDAIHRSNVPIAVATSKRESHARAILQLHSLESGFIAVHGAGEDDEGGGKVTVIRAALRSLAAAAEAPLMIGDRSFDIRAASAVGIPSLFAQWGYGRRHESEGSIVTASDPLHARELISPLLSRHAELNPGER
ncbi:HAD hydrolase-like protein [Yonghaparkia sp. Root332]|uniref:HAD hydrolase-like protein n=1 Tax=Yonghaparkia sp. Root332 TaxID=1736516 RepID=UPI0006F78453|nr:HAD hydrolase-like protein [Yonghaparkia sp. Root332]KQV26359.1 hypothetical protein ASC54_05545 [Yonghaparkia sp. Root332]